MAGRQPADTPQGVAGSRRKGVNRMAQFGETFEMAVKRMGVERAKSIAANVAMVATKNGLSQSQAEAVFEIAKDLLRTVPLGSHKEAPVIVRDDNSKMQ